MNKPRHIVLRKKQIEEFYVFFSIGYKKIREGKGLDEERVLVRRYKHDGAG